MDNKDVNNDLIKIQYQEGVTTFRTQISLMIQIITVLAIGNITVVGFAFQNKSSSLLFVGSIFPIFVITITKIVKRLISPILQTCCEIEDACLKHDTPKLVNAFLRQTKTKKNNESDYNFRFSNSNIFQYIFICFSIGQILLGIILYFYSLWSLI
jgi:hypothetical protein